MQKQYKEENMENNWSEYLPAAGYQEFKGLVDKELNQAAEGFVRIGYLLKVAREKLTRRRSRQLSIRFWKMFRH